MKKISILLLFVLAALFTGSLQAQTSPFTSTTPGTTTWTCPAGVTEVTIECWGAGGAGGSAYQSTAYTQRTGGGAGGSYAKKTFTNLVPGQSYTYTVGAGGVGSIGIFTNGANGQSGGATYFIDNTTVNAIGGQGGIDVYNATVNSAGGSASTGGNNVGDGTPYLGGNGGNGTGSGTPGSGGGGGSAGSLGAGGNGGSGITAGAAGAGGGALGGTGTTTTNGIPGVGGNPGGGGAGGVLRNVVSGGGTLPASKQGGKGGDGQIKISWVVGGVDIDPTITFPLASVSKNYGDANITTQTASSNSTGAITYSSSNSAVASVNETTGEVTLGTAGTATITANQVAATGFLAGSGSYTIALNAIITTGTLNNGELTYEAGFGPSAEANFTVSATGLTHDVTVTCSTNLEVSTTSGAGFGTTATFTQTGGALDGGATVYVRIKAGVSPNTISPANRVVTLTSTNATTKTVSMTSAIVYGITNSLANGFTNTISYTYVSGGPSTERNLTVNGDALYSATAVVVTPGSNMEISSTTGTGFGSTPISITVATNKIPTTTIYARLKAGLVVGSYTDATTKITASVTGGTFASKEIAFNCTVTTAPTISFALATINKINGDATFTQTATSNSAGTITYSSANTGVATVDPTSGAVTIVGAGSSVITATQTENGYYSSGTTTYTVSVVVADANVSTTQNISVLALPVSGSVKIEDDGDLTIDQNTESVTMSVSPLGKVTLPDNTTLTSSTITLQSNAGGTASFVDLNNTSPQTVTGTVQQYLAAERNWYTSSPITAGTAANLNRGTSVQTYSEASKTWTILAGSDALTNGKGYVSVAKAGTGTLTPGTISFNGTLNSGTVTVPVTRTETGSSRGFNLVANPYPSYLDWSLVTADGDNANIGTTMWFRTKTGGNAYTFSTYNSDGNVAVGNSANTTISKLIPPVQAFWIRVNANVGITTYSTSITFKNTMRAHKDVSGNTFKAPKLNTQQLLRLQISNETYSDEAVVYFNANASNAFDSYDSQKMFESESALKPEIYTQIGAEQLVINGLNAIQYDVEIPLGYVAKEAGVYSISRPEMTNFEAGTRIILKDKLNANTETELSDGIAYNFNSDITAATTDRFSLIFRAPGTTTGVNNAGNLNAQVFVNAANQITMIAPEKCNYNIYNAVGMQLEKGTVNGSEANIPICRDCKLQTGVYVVRLTDNGKEFTTRVIIK
jgi:hypothetical protein